MLIDAHVHLDKYGDRLDDALKEIETEQIFTVATAMDVPSYLELQRIAERSELVLPTFGIHPRRAAEYADRRAIIHWYSGPMDILKAMIDYGCYFTVGVEMLYSDYIRAIAKEIPD